MTTKTKPAETAFVVTPSDSVDLTEPIGGSAINTRGLYVGGAGDLSVEMFDPDGRLSDKTVVFTGVVAGSILPLSVTRVNSTLTTATTIVALW